MNNYATKRNLRDDKINEILNENKPKISKENLLKIFNRLIEDSNRRNEANLKIEILKKSNIILKSYFSFLIRHHKQKNRPFHESLCRSCHRCRHWRINMFHHAVWQLRIRHGNHARQTGTDPQ